MPSISEIAEIAYNALECEKQLLDKYRTPEAVLDYLQNDENFISLSEIIKAVMVKAQICEYNTPLSTYVDALFLRLIKQDKECNYKTIPKNTVLNWLNGTSRSIRKRFTVIKICFALGLDLDESKDLLNKCGYNGLNVRNAEEATYMYCILKNKSLFNARKILSIYKTDISDNQDKINHSGDTTILLREELLFNNVSWQNDEQFINTFLKPNRAKFIGYSINTVHSYYKIKNVISLSEIIKAVMVKAQICEYNTPLSTYVDALFLRLIKQDKECNYKTIPKNTVLNWLNGTSRSIRKRFTVIKICFALGLDLDESKDLLNKCGYNGLNVRNAEEATYMYCILKNKSLFNARKILSIYKTDISDNQDKINHSGDTTILLREELLFNNVSWQNDEQFINTFLKPNRAKFIGYSINTVHSYYKIKNGWFISVIIYQLKQEEVLLRDILEQNDDYSSGVLNKENASLTRKDIAFTKAFKSALKRYKERVSMILKNTSATDTKHKPTKISETLLKAHSLLTEDMLNAFFVFSTIKKSYIENENDIQEQKELSIFLSYIIKIEGILKITIQHICNHNKRIRPLTLSSLSDSVMKEFPIPGGFSKYEQAPSIIDKGMIIRKTIILMYYLEYAYEWFYNAQAETFGSEIGSKNISVLFKKFSFENFINELNKILTDCNLPTLYPALQFDWLILRSVRKFDVSDYDDLVDGSPAKFFNDVLAYSFGEIPSEEEF